MKTITIKTKTHIPNFPKSQILVDGENYGKLKGNSTQYLEVPTDAQNISVVIQGVTSNEYDITDNQHNAIEIHPNNLNTYDTIAVLIALGISLGVVFGFELPVWLIPIFALPLYLIHYFSRNKKLSIKIIEYKM